MSRNSITLVFARFLLLSCAMTSGAADLYVDLSNTTPGTTFEDWDTAATSIQAAVDVAGEGDTIWIRPGRYVAPHTPTNFAGANNVVHMDNKLVSLVATNDRPGVVLIDGEGANRGISVNRPVQSSAHLLIEGITISNCVVTAAAGENAFGGGIYFLTRSESTAWGATLQNCLFTHNTAIAGPGGTNAFGGAFYCKTSTGRFDLTITNCFFIANRATHANLTGKDTAGGAIYLRSFGNLKILNSTFEGNKALASGGAIFMEPYGGVAAKLTQDCIFRDNAVEEYFNASSGGGAIQGISTYRNCLFVGNTSVGWGGVGNGCAIFLDRSGPLLMENCTVVDNRVLTREGGDYNVGGALYIRVGSSDQVSAITNSIVYYNIPNDFYYGGTVCTNSITHSCVGRVTGYQDIINIITNEPAFVDRENRNFNLRGSSLCINAGLNLDWMGDSLDLAGNKRINWNTVDIGAYEYQFAGSVLLIR